MKRIVIAASLVGLMLMTVSTARAGQAGQCNALLGQFVGDSQQFLNGNQDCGNVIADGVEFANGGCFGLLFAGELFVANLGPNAASVIGGKICGASCTCFAPVPPGSPLDLACGCN